MEKEPSTDEGNGSGRELGGRVAGLAGNAQSERANTRLPTLPH